MADSKDEERDEEWFKEVYGKEYTGPPRPANENALDNSSLKKRSITQTNTSAGESDEDDEPRDPNAVPTDFTSREAKVWEAKAKAVERNWKKKKEEELICRICGEYGHFPQGCPTTLGGNRKQNEIVERVPVKDKRLKPRIIGTGGATIQGIEKETGCRLRLEDSLTGGNGAFFVRISGTNRIMIAKAVEAVKTVLVRVQDDRKQQNPRRPQGSQNRGPNVNPLIAAQMQHIANQRMQHNPNMQPYSGQPDVLFGEDEHSIEQIANQLEARRQWEAGNPNGSISMGAFGLKGGSHYTGLNQDGRTNQEKGSGNSKDQDHVPEMDSGYEQQSKPQSLEALEHRFVQDTMELSKELNDAEDKENARHRECLRDIQAQYQQKMATLRAQQTKRREEFLRHEAQVRQQQYQQHQGGTSYYNYNITGTIPSFTSSSHDQLGYGMDRNEGFGGYGGSFQGEGSYYNTPHPFNRNPGYESGMLLPGNQAFDAGRYRF